MYTPLTWIIVALFGLVLGSFLNVCIVRVPRRKSVVSPGSHCPQCGHAIRWYDNLPVLSYVLLRGRCRDCHAPISWFYPVVESFTAVVFVLAFLADGMTLSLVRNLVFSTLIIILIFTDLRERRIPHRITLPGAVLGLLLSVPIPVDARPVRWLLSQWKIVPPAVLLSVLGSLAGALFGAGLFFGVGEAFYRIRHKEGLGFGDVMLMLMAGTFLGPALTLVTILFGSLLGTFIGVPFALASRKYREYPWPYGTFLGLAAIYASLYGEPLLAAYLRWAGFR